MNKDRLEWVVSGLNQYALTKAEDQFIKTVLEDFDKTLGLTGNQEERLERLYKEKSKLAPNKINSAFKKAGPEKTKVRKPRAKVYF
jgi:hypothetical protein